MLTGSPLFTGKTVSSILADVLRSEPDWTHLPPNLHPRVRIVLERALERQVKDRLSAMSDARVELQKALVESGGTVKPSASRTSVSRATVAVGAVAALLLVALAGFAGWTLKPSDPRPVTRWTYQAPGLPQVPIRHMIAIARDGSQFAWSDGVDGIYIRSMDADAATLVRNQAGTVAFSPVFSPDGKWLAFWSSGEQLLKKVSAAGGTPIPLATVDENPTDITWDTDDTLYYVRASGVWRLSAEGGTPELVVASRDATTILTAQFLPGPKVILATVAARGTGGAVNVAAYSSSGRRSVLFPGIRARYLETGHIVCIQGDVLYAVPFDLDRLQPTGAAVPLVQNVRPDPAQYAVSNSGTLIYVRGSGGTVATQAVLAWVDLNGSTSRLAVPPMAYRHPRLSRDGTRVAAYTVDASGESRIWVYDLDGKSQIQPLAGKGHNSRPIWTPDGRRLAFTSDRDGTEAIWWQMADGSSPAERLTTGEAGLSHWPDAFSPDGKFLGFTKYRTGFQEIWTLSLDNERALKMVAGGTGTNQAGGLDFSSDGRWIAYRTNKTNPNHIQLQPFPTTGVEYDTASAGGSYPVFSRNGRQLFYRRQVAGDALAEGLLAAVDVSPGPAPRFTNERVLPLRNIRVFFGHRDYDVSIDGNRLLVVLPENGAEGQRAAPPPEINVVLNWFEELRSRVPR
jgi:Tol biopolymer transport system component